MLRKRNFFIHKKKEKKVHPIESTVCSFGPFFKRSIFLKKCEKMSPPHRWGVYVTSSYPVAFRVHILSSTEFTSLYNMC